MRVMAQISGDIHLANLFNLSGDVYIELASKIFNKTGSEISKQQREQAKVICLGLQQNNTIFNSFECNNNIY